MPYALGQTIEVFLELDLPPAQGVRLVVATFENERGDVVELTEEPAEESECFLAEAHADRPAGASGPPRLLRTEALEGGTPARRDPRGPTGDRL